MLIINSMHLIYLHFWTYPLFSHFLESSLLAVAPFQTVAAKISLLCLSGIWQAKCSNIQFILFLFNSIFHVQLFVQYSTFIQYSMLQFH